MSRKVKRKKEERTDGEWKNVEAEIIDDVLVKFEGKHGDRAGRQIGNVVD